MRTEVEAANFAVPKTGWLARLKARIARSRIRKFLKIEKSTFSSRSHRRFDVRLTPPVCLESWCPVKRGDFR